MKKIGYFFTCLISSIRCWNVTQLSRHSGRLMNERRSLHHSQSKVVWQNYCGLWQLRRWKIRIAYRQWRANFPRWGRKPKYEKGNRFGDSISRGRERKSTTGRFATSRFWPCTWNISSVAKDDINNWQFCILKIRPIVCFHLEYVKLFSVFFIRGLSILLFSFINKVDFCWQ